MDEKEWHDFSKTPLPPPDGHIVTGHHRPDGSWCITAIHPPGVGRDCSTPEMYWSRLPDWLIQGPQHS